MEVAERLVTPRQRPQGLVSTPCAPVAAHRLRAHRTTFSGALGSAQMKSGAAEQQKAGTYSTVLGRVVQQMDELQTWLQSTSEGRALSPEDARTTVDALEKVEECLGAMETLCSGGTPNTCAQLLRRADKEEAAQGSLNRDEAWCGGTAPPLSLYHIHTHTHTPHHTTPPPHTHAPGPARPSFNQTPAPPTSFAHHGC